jgi:hypothetical protein
MAALPEVSWRGTLMAIRTTRIVVKFAAPFELDGLDGWQPAGAYSVQTDEEIMEGNERITYLRTGTAIEIRTPGRIQLVPVKAADLDAAIERDKRRSTMPETALGRADQTISDEEAAMAQFGITRVPTEHFLYKAFRYTKLSDALAQARRDNSS